MKKIILFILFNVAFFIFLPKEIASWSDCPYGKINDPYPGSCGLYLDTNNNKICDRSESKPTSEVATQTIQNRPIFWPIFLSLSFYFLSWYLVFKTKLGEKLKWLNRLSFYYFWNLILLLTFMVTSASGILLLIGTQNTSLLFWHNQAGIVFIIVAFIHTLRHLRYFIKSPNSN